MEGKQYIIGVAGGSGSGKTTFVQILRDSFTENELCLLSLDNYYIPRDEQVTDKMGVKNFDLPGSINAQALFNDLEKLRKGQSFEKQEYVFNNENAEAATIVVQPAPIILIEGLFIYHYKILKDIFDLKLYIHAKENLKLIRRIKRDQVQRNYPIEDVMYRYEHHVMPSYEKFIKRYKDDADIIINNNTSLDRGLKVTSTFIRSLLDSKT